MAEHQRAWEIFVENREAVIAALERGKCCGILPAARGFLDGFAGFLLEAGVLDVRTEPLYHQGLDSILALSALRLVAQGVYLGYNAGGLKGH